MKKNGKYTRATIYFWPEIHNSLRLRSAKASVAAAVEAIEPQRDRRALRLKVAGLIGNPRPPTVEPLPGYADRYRLRHGRFRIVYRVDDSRKEATIVSIGYRTR